MNINQSLLREFVIKGLASYKKELRGPFLQEFRQQFSQLAPEEVAEAFIDVTFLGSALIFLQGEQWTLKKDPASSSENYRHFAEQTFASNLLSLNYLQDTLQPLNEKELRRMAELCEELEKILLSHVQSLGQQQKNLFVTRALQLMEKVFAHENSLWLQGNSQARSLALSLYRTFDGLDQIFGLNYDADLGMKTDVNGTERLYEGAGLGVQSSYSTLLTALREVQASQGTRFIDLGSGYGRVGLVVGVLRPDIDFIGYEYVKHRVDISNESTAKFGLQGHVHFFTQDLSEKNFRIPDADVYYMFDPFSKDTYQHVLNQLVEVSRRQRIVVVTKGNARLWLKEIAEREGWLPGQEFDGGNLSLFRSRE